MTHLWFPHVGFEMYTLVPGMNLAMKAAPTRREPEHMATWKLV